jgi:glycosyltransferase involved in cell wall biosynthesis
MGKPRILFLMHMPPPVHGAAVMGGIVRDCEAIREHFECRYLNYSISRSMDEIDRFCWKKIRVVGRLLFRVFREVIRFRPDVVYVTPSFRRLGFRKDRLVVRFLRSRGCRVVLHLHNKGVSTLAEHPGFDRKFRDFFQGTNVILISERLYPDVARYVAREDVRFCPNGIDPVLETVPVREETGTPELLFMSNVLGSKGASDLLDACRILTERGIAFHCRFVGCISQGFHACTFERMVRERGLEGKVSFSGPLYGDEKKEAYRRADIFVHPTREDCFPLVILEAMSAGLPVVASEEGGIPDEVADGETGLLFRKGDITELANCLETLLSNPSARWKMGAAGLERFGSLFTRACFEDRLFEIMEELVHV